jgi:hypothetical protein
MLPQTNHSQRPIPFPADCAQLSEYRPSSGSSSQHLWRSLFLESDKGSHAASRETVAPKGARPGSVDAQMTG